MMGSSTVDLSCFHDAELIELTISQKLGQVRLAFSTENGDVLRVSISGVRAIRAVDIGMQNVVSRIISSRHLNLSDDELANALRWISATSDSPPYFSQEAMVKYTLGIRERKFALLMIEPSAGVELAVLADEVAFDFGADA